MKTRVTFRLPSDLADELRELENQTQFVESSLREALGVRCPLCAGSGRLRLVRLWVSNFKHSALPPLERHSAIELKRLVRIARQLSATRVKLEAVSQAALVFELMRGSEVLLRGTLPARGARPAKPS